MAKLRLRITKEAEIRFISHLDYVKALMQALRRAHLPVAYSEGFNPHMKVSFASALAVGVISLAEYVDVEMTEIVDTELIQRRLDDALPKGIRLVALTYLAEREPALMAQVERAEYDGILPSNCTVQAVQNALAAFDEAEEVLYYKKSPKGNKTISVKEYIAEPMTVCEKEGTLQMRLVIKVTPTGSIKPSEVIGTLAEQFGFPVKAEDVLYIRKDLLVRTPWGYQSPLG